MRGGRCHLFCGVKAAICADPLVWPRVLASAESGVDFRTRAGIVTSLDLALEAVLPISPDAHSRSLCCRRGDSVRSPGGYWVSCSEV